MTALLVAVALTLPATLRLEAQTQAGGPIQLVKNINQTAIGVEQPSDLAVIGDTLYFVQEIEPYGRELWRSNGTAVDTRLVKDIHPGILDGEVSELTNVGGTLFLKATNSVTGVELWKAARSTPATGAKLYTLRIADLRYIISLPLVAH